MSNKTFGQALFLVLLVCSSILWAGHNAPRYQFHDFNGITIRQDARTGTMCFLHMPGTRDRWAITARRLMLDLCSGVEVEE